MLSKAGAHQDRMRVGVLGAGAMGEKHLESRHTLGIPVAGVYARNVESARAAAARCDSPVYDSLSALLRDVEIADICLPTFLHQAAAENVPFEVIRQEVLRALRVAVAARQCAQHGRPVPLEPDAETFTAWRSS